jgi:hypothetical protein
MRIRYLVYFILLLFLIEGCNPYKHQLRHCKNTSTQVNSFLNKADYDLHFHTTIDFYNKHYTGILICKKGTDLLYHFVFITEIGMKVFDYAAAPDSLHIVYVFPGLAAQPKALNLLKHDLGYMFMIGINPASKTCTKDSTTLCSRQDEKYCNYYLLDSKTLEPRKAIRYKGFKKKTKISYTGFKEGKPQQIALKHKGILRLKIVLDRLEE